jgi:tetratricopeptide (TPR) repeat protein
MLEVDHAHGLVIREHPFELQAAKEQGLVGTGTLLHDAGDAGIIIVPEAEGLRAPGEPPLPDREGKGAVEGDDERAAGGLVLQLLQEHEEQGLEPLVLIESAIPGMPVYVLLADPEGDGPNQGGEGRRPRHGARQLVFVGGEAGVNKTTVVEVFLARLAAGSGVWMAWGQCVEHAGLGEPYLPVLEALGQLSRGPRQQDVLAALRRYAPMWLVQLPGLLPEPELERLQRQAQGATSARMLRELAEVLEVLTAETPLVRVLEDLHWSDHSTVDFLAYVAQRRAPARLLVVGTYRPVETLIRAHPLRGIVQELCGRGRAVERRLELLLAEDVAVYVAGRLGGPVAAPLTAFIHARTEGHALFMVNIVAHLVQQGWVVRREAQWTLREGADAKVASLPQGLQQFLMRRIEALPLEARQVLEVASVVGETFAAAAVSAGLQCPAHEVEVQCERLVAQHHFIDDRGVTEWPDATCAGSYQFQHALYPQVLYEQLGTTRRMHLHRRIGLRLEDGYGAQAREIAAQLAVHFERGGETARAVHYWQQAGDNAARRNAPDEAIAALTKGRALLATLPDSPEQLRHELTLLLMLGEFLMAMKGMAAPEAGDVYIQAHTLAQQLGETPQSFRVLLGLYRFHGAQARLSTARELAEQLLHLAQRQYNAVLLLEGHLAVGVIALYRGDLVTARAHLEESLCRCTTQPPSTPTFGGGHAPRVQNLIWLAQVLWGLGYTEQAQQRSQEALALAQQVGHPPSLSFAAVYATVLSQCRRELEATHARAEAVMAVAAAHGFVHRVGHGRLLRGWALAMRGDAVEGVAQIRQGLAVSQGEGLNLFRPYFLSLLAEACGQAGQPAAGLTALTEASTLVATTEERW